MLGIHDNVFGGSHIILAVNKRLTNATSFSGLNEDVLSRFILDFFGNEAETLVEWEHLFSLVDNLVESVLKFVLVQFQLDTELRVVLVVAHSELWHVAKLS